MLRGTLSAHVMYMYSKFRNQNAMEFAPEYVHVLNVHRPNMNNVTSRLAIQIKHIPEGQADWHDSKPQQTVSPLTTLHQVRKMVA